MISADHVRARRRGGELKLTQLKPKDRDEMTLYATRAVRLLKGGLHKRREELESQFDDIIVPAYLTRVADGLKKMLVPPPCRRAILRYCEEMRKQLRKSKSQTITFKTSNITARLSQSLNFRANSLRRKVFSGKKI